MQRDLVRFLRWSEKYTKTDMLYLSSGGFWLTVSNVLGAATSFATSIAFANWLPQETYGIFRYLISVLPILTIPTLIGIDTALTRAVAQGKESTLYPALALKMKWGVFGTIGTLGFALYYYMQGDIRLTLIFLITACAIPFMEPFNLFVAFLTGKGDFMLRTYYATLSRVVPTIILITTVFFTSNIFILVLSYFLSYSVIRLIALYYSARRVPKNGETDLAALGFGKHLSIMGVLNTVSTSLDSILMFHFGGAAVLAGYYLAMVPYKQVSNIFSSISILALPKLSLHNPESLKHTLPPKVWRLGLVVLLAMIIYIVAAPIFFSILYPQYVSYVYLSDLFMLQLLFFPANIFYAAITAQGDKNTLYFLNITNAITRIGLLLILIPLYGLWGAAAAIIISGLLVAILKTYTFFKLPNSSPAVE